MPKVLGTGVIKRSRRTLIARGIHPNCCDHAGDITFVIDVVKEWPPLPLVLVTAERALGLTARVQESVTVAPWATPQPQSGE